VAELIDLLLHVDRYLLDLVANYGVWIYAILFVIVFAETGLVVTPFLPGDSLLFATGALAATGALNIWVAVILLLAAAVAGDAVNYAVGRSAGLRVIELSKTHPTWRRWINPDYIARAHDFFERQGGKAIVLGRFMPIVRTFVPFVAGVAGLIVAFRRWHASARRLGDPTEEDYALVAAALVACIPPAIRAMNVDPVAGLRAE